ncbi:MAG: HD-GYP domain-containing protein [Bacteroidota bacterium]
MNNREEELEIIIDELGDHLAESFYSTIQVLSAIIARTEKYFEGSHARFVSSKSAQLAKELGMNEDETLKIKLAGLLHDLGKIGFSDSELFKNSNDMNSLEFKNYTKHPKIGSKLLEGHKDFEQLREIIEQHHEKLDGSGFPNHLKENYIHPGARIIIVVDAYHNAMYKKQRNRYTTSSVPITNTTALLDSTRERYNNIMNYLTKKSGFLYDKKVVDRFINMMEIERMNLGKRSILRIPVNKMEPGMLFAEDYFTSYGMLIAAKGETMTKEMKNALVRFAEAGEIPHKILVMK